MTAAGTLKGDTVQGNTVKAGNVQLQVVQQIPLQVYLIQHGLVLQPHQIAQLRKDNYNKQLVVPHPLQHLNLMVITIANKL